MSGHMEDNVIRSQYPHYLLLHTTLVISRCAGRCPPPVPRPLPGQVTRLQGGRGRDSGDRNGPRRQNNNMTRSCCCHGTEIRTSGHRTSGHYFTITENAPSRAFSWLTAATIAFTFKNLLRHYANQPTRPFDLCVGNPISCLLIVGSTPV